CYGRRAVPQLARYIVVKPNRDPRRIIVSSHSQGTIIAAAALLNVGYKPGHEDVALMTFGSPLRRLYAQNFPAYFGLAALDCLRNHVLSVPDKDYQRWINMWSLTDPIGSYVFDYENKELARALQTVDWRIPDVSSLEQGKYGDYPPICGHSG